MIPRINVSKIKEKVGLLLDQAQPESKKCDTSNVCRNKILNRLNNIFDDYTQVYGITLTFKLKFSDYCDEVLHREIKERIDKSTLFKQTKYVLFPEYTQKGTLHYHGIIYDCYQVEYMKCVKWWRRNYGFVKPELKIKYPKKWIQYITKDLGKTGLYTLYKFID